MVAEKRSALLGGAGGGSGSLIALSKWASQTIGSSKSKLLPCARMGLVASVCVCTYIFTLCAYAQQGYAFGCVRLYVCMYICIYIYIYIYIYMYVNKKTGCFVPYCSKIC